MRRFTGPLPFCIEPRRHKAGAHRVELCRAALETACSPRSTLLFRVSERNRTRCLDVHRVACHPATPQTPSTSLLKKVSGTLKACEKTGALFCPQGSRHLFQQAVVP